MHGAHGGLRLRADRADGAEIVRALKGARSAVHHLFVEVLGVKVSPVDIERVFDAGIINTVGVFLFLTREDRVEIIRHLKRLAHDDILRRVCVDGKRQALDWNARLCVEIGDVALGVHARVRAAAADELDVPAADLREALFHRLADA